MLKLDNNLLAELGLGSLPEDQKKAMLQHIYETLELRVGTQLANQMTDKQLEEFERFIDAGGDQNQAQALQWLESNLPNYKQVVNDVFEALKVEIKGMAPQIVATAQQQPAVGQPQDASQQAYTQPYQQPQVAQASQPSATTQSYTVVEPTADEQKTIQLYLENNYQDVAMVVDSNGQRLLRSRAPLDSNPTYKSL
ncbi:hypothetical protein IPL85_03185 [Candidatus Saccharibacteria bacterium]|nr:MAG: hypothetical protein IPL85_03185 [Candidatus Saccharibacteria bacterium]